MSKVSEERRRAKGVVNTMGRRICTSHWVLTYINHDSLQFLKTMFFVSLYLTLQFRSYDTIENPTDPASDIAATDPNPQLVVWAKRFGNTNLFPPKKQLLAPLLIQRVHTGIRPAQCLLGFCLR